MLKLLEVEQKLNRAGLLQTDEALMEFRNGVSSAEDLQQYAGKFLIAVLLCLTHYCKT